MNQLAPDPERLLADLETLAGFTEPATPGWTRRFPSPAYLAGRAWLRGAMEQAGLSTRIDAGGNLLGTQHHTTNLPSILIGSHTDTVLGGGRYDGTLGVLAALEVVRCLADAGITLHHPLMVADFLAEEANAFGISCVGSRALTGTLQPAWLERTLAGVTLAEAIRAAGGNPTHLTKPLLAPSDLAACLELHIEQGPVLDQHGHSLAAVTGIVGIRRGTLHLHGQPDHAGTTPMELRHDALAVAAVIISTLERLCTDSSAAVGTVGRLEVGPNQSNVVPAEVLLTAEIRSLAPAVLEEVWDALMQTATTAAAQRGVQIEQLALTTSPPVQSPPWLVALVHAACRSLDPHAPLLPSGAGHDSSQLARLAPTAMIFVPSVGGRSHCPAEHTDPQHLALGVAALARSVVAVDRTLANPMPNDQ